MLEIPLTITVILIGAIIAQGSFAAILLLMHRDNPRSNPYLGLLLLAFSLWLLDDFFNAAKIYQQNPNFYFLPIYFSFAFGPLIYFYTKSITDSKFIFTKKLLVHFIPVALQLMLYVFLQCKDYSFRRWFWQEVHLPYTYNIEFIGSMLSLLVYLLLSITRVKEYQVWINNQFSEISKISLHWLKLILGVLMLVCSLWILDTLLRIGWQYYPSYDLSAISMGFSILVLAAGALLQSNIGKTGLDKTKTNQRNAEMDVGIDPLLLDKIKAEMKENKYFLNPNLSLKIFADHLGESPRKISHHINHGLGKSFIDFVNEYRVNACKRHIETGALSHLTLTGIAFECGFNSKATFNRVFKKMAGQSPSNYQKMHQNRE